MDVAAVLATGSVTLGLPTGVIVWVVHEGGMRRLRRAIVAVHRDECRALHELVRVAHEGGVGDDVQAERFLEAVLHAVEVGQRRRADVSGMRNAAYALGALLLAGLAVVMVEAMGLDAWQMRAWALWGVLVCLALFYSRAMVLLLFNHGWPPPQLLADETPTPAPPAQVSAVPRADAARADDA